MSSIKVRTCTTEYNVSNVALDAKRTSETETSFSRSPTVEATLFTAMSLRRERNPTKHSVPHGTSSGRDHELRHTKGAAILQQSQPNPRQLNTDHFAICRHGDSDFQAWLFFSFALNFTELFLMMCLKCFPSYRRPNLKLEKLLKPEVVLCWISGVGRIGWTLASLLIGENRVDVGKPVDVRASGDELKNFKDYLRGNSIQYTIQIENVDAFIAEQALVSSRTAVSERSVFNFHDYHQVSLMEKQLLAWERQYGVKRAFAHSIGSSFQGRDILGMKVSFGETDRPLIVIEAGIFQQPGVSQGVQLTHALNCIKDPEQLQNQSQEP
ncbi:unnamed protein product [Notodromas monacha]|uniref:Carboxypeptidase activation peptide domain-containing protein n=1 Tax=Notodromas monacha TaxID=399045 RepID=A0A7R9BVS2_9CRUS|nr:unnamed protein product [Notodromas monacha]CAG0922288.1 unnamed protein product [Notodromas monacha]